MNFSHWLMDDVDVEHWSELYGPGQLITHVEEGEGIPGVSVWVRMTYKLGIRARLCRYLTPEGRKK